MRPRLAGLATCFALALAACLEPPLPAAASEPRRPSAAASPPAAPTSPPTAPTSPSVAPARESTAAALPSAAPRAHDAPALLVATAIEFDLAAPQPAAARASTAEPKLAASAPPSAPPASAAQPAAAAPEASVAPAASSGVATAADRSKCASCHAGLTADKKVHAVLRNDGCKACHAPAAGAAGKCGSADAAAWKLVAAQPALCQKCHSTTAASGKQHKPIAGGSCTACHDPHASKNPTLMKVWPLEASCYKCHARVDDDRSVHTPIKTGDCKGCHEPHSSEFGALLVADKDKLCFECHKPEKLKHGKVGHPPFAEGRCLDCHDPHRSESAPVLRASGRALCLSCHDAKAKSPVAVRPALRIDLSKADVHRPLRGDGACQQCHTQKHGGASPSLLDAPDAPQLCFRCHAKFDDLAHPHGAIKTGKCTTCHDPHSADRKGLLRASKERQLCHLCHADDLTGRRVIHQPINEKGCTACHDAHGSDHPFDLDGEGKDVCYKCHKPVDKVKRPHAVLARDGCTGCHDPHGSDNAQLLIKSVNALCSSCHDKQKTGDHVSSPPHKMSGGVDPKHKEKEFSCVSCHDPHGTDNPKLFRFGASAKGMCVYCHGDKTQKVTER